MKFRRGLAILAALILTVTAIPMDTLQAATVDATDSVTEVFEPVADAETGNDFLQEEDSDERYDPLLSEEKSDREVAESAEDNADGYIEESVEAEAGVWENAETLEETSEKTSEEYSEEIHEEVPEETEENQELLGDSVSVILDGNGGHFSGGTETVETEIDDSLRIDGFELYHASDLYWFCGWYSDPACTQRLSADEDDNLLKEKPANGSTLYAGYSDERVKVTYDFGDKAYYDGYMGNNNGQESSVVSVYARKDRPLRDGLDSPYSNFKFIHYRDLHDILKGWALSEGGEVVYQPETEYIPTQDVTLYAVYERYYILLTLHANGGYYQDGNDPVTGLSIRPETRQYGTGKNGYFHLSNRVNEYLPYYTNAKKVFTGWYTSASCDTAATIYNSYTCQNEIEWNDSDTFPFFIKAAESDIDLYAGWKDADYVLTLDPNVDDGYFRDDDTRNIRMEKKEIGAVSGKITERYVYNPKRDDKHYKFMGWCSDQACTSYWAHANEWESSSTKIRYSLTENTTWYAKWEEKYNVVTFDANGGTFDYYDEGAFVTDATEAQIRIDDYGKLVSEPGIPNSGVDGQIFEGWYNEENRRVDLKYLYAEEDVTLKAKYADCYNVTLDYNGGYYREENPDGSVLTQTDPKVLRVIKGNSIVTWRDGDNIEARIPTAKYPNDEKAFGGWYLSSDTGFTTPIDPWDYYPQGNVKLVARWLDSFKVTFNAGRGLIGDKRTVTVAVPENTQLGDLEGFEIPKDLRPVSSYQIFSGWFTDEECTQPITETEILGYQVSADVTFYAGYRESVQITFDLNDKDAFYVNPDIRWQALYENYSIRIASGGPIRGMIPSVDTTAHSKVFSGWFLDKDCTQEIDVYKTVFTAACTVYAGWEDCYTLTFHLKHPDENDGGAKFTDTLTDVIEVKVIKGEPYRYTELHKDHSSRQAQPGISMGENGTRAALPYWFDEMDGKAYAFNKDLYTEGTCSLYGFIPTRNMDFYPQWEDTVAVTFDANKRVIAEFFDDEQTISLVTNGFFYHGTCLDGDLSKCVVRLPKGIRFSDVPKPRVEAYDVDEQLRMDEDIEWGYKDQACRKQYAPSDVILDETTVYGKKVKIGGSGTGGKWTLTYHAGDGYFDYPEKKEQNVRYSNSNTEWITTPEASIDDETRVFSGWFTDAELTKPYAAENTRFNTFYWGEMRLRFPAKVPNLYAKFDTANAVTFDANGGYFDQDDERVKDPDYEMRETTILSEKTVQGQPVAVNGYSARIRRDGSKIFGGWYLDKECTQKAPVCMVDWMREYFYPMQRHTTLYAKWVDYCKPESIGISVNNKEATTHENAIEFTIDIGETVDLNAQIIPEIPENAGSIRWSIGDYSALTDEIRPVRLDINGKVTGQSKGTCNVYAGINGVYSTQYFIIHVTGNRLPSTIAIKDRAGEDLAGDQVLCVNDTLSVKGLIDPESERQALAASVKWESSDPSVATVISDGDGADAIITAVGEGETDITVTLGKSTDSLHIVVTRPVKMSIPELTMTAKEGVSRDVIVTVIKEINTDSVTFERLTGDGQPADGLIDLGFANWTESGNTKQGILTVRPSAEAFALMQSRTITLKVQADLDGRTVTESCLITLNPQQRVEKVTASVTPGPVAKGTRILLTTATPGADICYRTEGGELADYTDAVTINKTTTIMAFAKKAGLKDSPEETFAYTVEDLGDVDDTLFAKASDVPDGIWYRFVNENYDVINPQAGAIVFPKQYTGNKITFNEEIEVYHGTARLVENRDYTLTYANNVNAAENNKMSGNKVIAPSVTVKGKGNYNASTTFYFAIDPTDMDKAAVTSEQVMTVAAGNKVKLSSAKPTVSFNGKNLTQGKDYVLKYYEKSTPNMEIADPDNTLLNEAGKTYLIEVAGKENSNFKEDSSITDLV
ncbi:MAG: InlB B-repeat-containing protein, partial [Lachnospiraceae bacterium]|nr:InlB B-repeat-containing protein [Lachnospiraceae bacterium]